MVCKRAIFARATRLARLVVRTHLGFEPHFVVLVGFCLGLCWIERLLIVDRHAYASALRYMEVPLRYMGEGLC